MLRQRDLRPGRSLWNKDCAHFHVCWQRRTLSLVAWYAEKEITAFTDNCLIRVIKPALRTRDHDVNLSTRLCLDPLRCVVQCTTMTIGVALGDKRQVS